MEFLCFSELGYETPPEILAIHCDPNDIGKI